MKKRQRKKVDKRRGKKGNGKIVQFPQQQQGITQPPPTDEQLAMQKRIEAAGENVLAALSGLSLIEVKGTLETVSGMLQRRIFEIMNAEKMEVPKDV